jgi:hypothetical protein
MKKFYINIKNPDKNANKLQICFDYDIGGFNPFTGRPTPRGYYLIITPVTVSGNMISFAAFSGNKYLLHETKRNSEAARQVAIDELMRVISLSATETANKNRYIINPSDISEIINNVIIAGGR